LTSVQDFAVIGAVTLALAMAVLTGYTVLSEMKAATDGSQMDQDTLQKGLDAYKIFGPGLVVFNSFTWIVGIILGLRVRSHPVFALPALIALGLSGFVSFQLANMYGAFASTSVFASSANQFPLLSEFMSSYGEITLVMGGIILTVLYGISGRSTRVTA